MAAGVKFDKRTMKNIKELLKNNPKWVSQAVNDTVRGIRTDITGDKVGVRTELNVKKKQVSENITLDFANKSKLKGLVSVKDKAISAYNKDKPWSGGDTKPGLNYQGKRSGRQRAKNKEGKSMEGKAFKYSFLFKKSNGRKIFNNAFPVKLKSGVGIAIRTDRKAGSKGKGQTIKKIYSSTVADVLSNIPILDAILKAAAIRMEKSIEKQMKRILQ